MRIATPIGVGALHGDLAAYHIRVQKVAEFLAEVRPDPHRHVVEIDEQRGLMCAAGLGVRFTPTIR